MSDEPQSHDEWAKSFQCDESSWVSHCELQAMYEATCRYGSGNCWTGTAGTLAAMVRRLLEERLRLVIELEKRSINQKDER